MNIESIKPSSLFQNPLLVNLFLKPYYLIMKHSITNIVITRAVIFIKKKVNKSIINALYLALKPIINYLKFGGWSIFVPFPFSTPRKVEDPRSLLSASTLRGDQARIILHGRRDPWLWSKRRRGLDIHRESHWPTFRWFTGEGLRVWGKGKRLSTQL